MLKIVDALLWIVPPLGGDPQQFRAIVQNKLMLDSRRPMVGFANRKERESGGSFTGAMFFYALIGLVLAGAIYKAPSPLVGMTILHTTSLIMLTMTLIADFTNVLLDTTDNAIMQPKPVSGRTLFLARTAHISIYLGLLGLSLSIAALVIGAMRWSYLLPLVYLPTLAGGIILAICLASLFYLLALRFMDREKVRDILLYIQIGFSVLIFGGYQFMPRLMELADVQHARFDSKSWIWFYPPAWLAAPLDLVAGNVNRVTIGLTLLACIVPPIALLLVSRVLATRFNQMLAAMEITTERQTGPRNKDVRTLGASLAPLVGQNPVQRSTLEFVWTILSRDRQFKSRAYPSIAIMLIVPLGVLFSGQQGFWVALRELPSTQKHLFMLYLAAASLAPSIFLLRYSQYWQAAWIYEALPIARPGAILAPALVALMLRFVVPSFALISAALLWVWGPRILPDILLALLLTIALSLAEGIVIGRRLPFSEQFGVREGTGRFGKNMLLLALGAGLGGLHLLLRQHTWGVPAAIVVAVLLVYVLWSIFRSTSWEALSSSQQL
jgi:ABC-2 type transport system permease protein